MNDHTSITVEVAEEIMATHFPEGLGGKRPKVQMDAVFLSVEPLTSEDIAAYKKAMESGQPLGVQAVDIKALRHTHHRLAQMLAVGVDETVAAKLCNYSISRVSILKSDPAFAELLAHYSEEVHEEWADFVATAANLSMDFLQELQHRLDEKPEQFSVGALNEVLKTLADRTGHAPVTKTQNVNVNLNLGDKLRMARERANAAYIDGQARLVDSSNG
jgi:hypothetical protein